MNTFAKLKMFCSGVHHDIEVIILYIVIAEYKWETANKQNSLPGLQYMASYILFVDNIMDTEVLNCPLVVASQSCRAPFVHCFSFSDSRYLYL